MPDSVFTGNEWLDRWMEAQASLQAQQFFLIFIMGQLAAAATYDRAKARQILEHVEQDIVDVETASAQLAHVSRSIAANVRANIEAPA